MSISQRSTQLLYNAVEIPPSPDKYTCFIRNYVGKNLASFGYTSWGSDRMDHYGSAYLKLVLLTTDGSFMDVENEQQLSSYIVTAQDIQPTGKMQLVYRKDSDGNECSNLIDSQTYEKITLTLQKLDFEIAE